MGAEQFGWSNRNPQPAQVREGDWLLGIGMAAAVRTNRMAPSHARVTLTSAGRAVVETDMTDTGTGTYTILAQITAELLGLPVERVEVRLGDTAFPEAYGSGGSIGAGSSGSAVYAACNAIRKQISQPLDCAPWDLKLKDGRAVVAARSVSLAKLAGEASPPKAR
jgi:xanthine dehydrogenase YagR molybdenum-binding subunit